MEGFTFWRTKLNSAKLVVAPMVDQSELAWRILSRRHGAHLCYSPMYHAPVFIRDPGYRRDALATCPEDRPLIIQFCANDRDILLKAAKYAEPHCDAIDLNLGCPQAIAKRGHYGAFLQDEWPLIAEIVSMCAKELCVPITCKMRVFDDIEKTVQYAQMLEKAGCKLLTVHGRTREQKGTCMGKASWKHIKAVKEALNIPVFANGNIQYWADLDQCLQETGADGVMCAEGNLRNPAIFENQDNVSWDLALEYLDIVDQYPCPMTYMRGHMFKLFHHVLLVHPDMRLILGKSKSISDLIDVAITLKEKSKVDVERYTTDPEGYMADNRHLPLPYWICQPYVRPPVEQTEERLAERLHSKRVATPVMNNSDESLSHNKQKKLVRNPKKSFEATERFEKCLQCSNPKGLKCEYDLCKVCCKKKMHSDVMDCQGHKLFVKTRLKQKQKNILGDQNCADVVHPFHDCVAPIDCDSSAPELKHSEVKHYDDCEERDILAVIGT